ncbi:MAG: hypothetical protein J5I47_13345, partial [Vicingus serpentipes]|nr:hypothetical protein [Vicingus serpentipes]
VKELIKKGKAELQEIAKGMDITFQNNDTKEMLAKAIVAEEARIAEEAAAATEESSSGSGSEAKAKEEAEAKAKEVVYTLPEACKGVLDFKGNFIPREKALKDQSLLADLKKAGHKGVKIK